MCNGRLYTGYTSNLKRRFREHQRGGVASTRHRRPLDLIHAEAYLLKSDAERRERYLKTTEGKKLLRRQLRDVLAASAMAPTGSPRHATGRRVE
jgi:putative endonuclease